MNIGHQRAYLLKTLRRIRSDAYFADDKCCHVATLKKSVLKVAEEALAYCSNNTESKVQEEK
jgi:hypothetical protein